MDTEEEEWRPILGHPFYEVSNLGRVRSIDRVVATDSPTWQTGHALKGRILSPGKAKGYLQFHAGRGSSVYVHLAVLEAFIGPRPDGMQGCHNDGDCTNNVPANLRWDTRSGNNLDIVAHGRHRNARKMHCPRGHEYDGVLRNGLDSMGRPKMKRYCRACQSDANRRCQAAKELTTVK